MTWNIKSGCQNEWNYLFFIQNIFIVGVIMLSISNSWNSFETKSYLLSFSIDTKDSIFKRKFQFEQQIFHCSKKFEMEKFREAALWCLCFQHWKSEIESLNFSKASCKNYVIKNALAPLPPRVMSGFASDHSSYNRLRRHY